MPWQTPLNKINMDEYSLGMNINVCTLKLIYKNTRLNQGM